MPSLNYSGNWAKLRLWLGLCGLFLSPVFLCPNAGAEAVALVSPNAESIIGDQLKFYQVDADGVITATTDRNLQLHGMKALYFRLSGQVWLGGPSSASVFSNLAPDGFAIVIRQVDGVHRYELSSRAMIFQPITPKGTIVKKADPIASFQPPAMGEWIPFSMEAMPDQINFQFGMQHGVISGPLEIDGINYVSLSAGSKLKDLRLELLADSSGKVSSLPSVDDFLKAMVIIKGDRGQGSGFIVKKNGQLCVATNQHVLSGNSNFTITGIDGTTYPPDGALFGAIGYDVAMLRIPEAKNFITIDDNSNADAKIGNSVQVLGNAEGGGVVTQIPGKLLGIGPELVEVDAKFVLGNSGSPIIDNATHKVIGIATYIRKTYTQTELEQAANEPTLRWFGYRLDTIKQWQAIDRARFNSEATRLLEIEDRTASFVQLFQLLSAKTPMSAHLKDSNIDAAYATFIAQEQRAIAINSKIDVLSALKQLMTALTPDLDNDTSALSDLKLYSFHTDELQAQMQIREVIRKGFNDTTTNIQNMTSDLGPK